jgi:Peptidase family M23
MLRRTFLMSTVSVIGMAGGLRLACANNLDGLPPDTPLAIPPPSPRWLHFPAPGLRSYANPPPDYQFVYPPSHIEYAIALSRRYYNTPLQPLTAVQRVFDSSFAAALGDDSTIYLTNNVIPRLAPPFADPDLRTRINGDPFFGARRERDTSGGIGPHYGVDLAAPAGLPVFAVQSGAVKVIRVYPDAIDKLTRTTKTYSALGILIRGDYLVTKQFYIDPRADIADVVRRGVRQGELLGTVQPQWRDARTPPHVHLEILAGSTGSNMRRERRPYIDPTPYLQWWRDRTSDAPGRDFPRSSNSRLDRMLP